MPDISVLLPCYNASKTLKETLTSLQEQTYQDFEVICVDDGSTDDTPDILKNWSQDDPRFTYVPKEHSGVVETANLGLASCRGQIIVRMDADDLNHPRRIELQRDYLIEVIPMSPLLDHWSKDFLRTRSGRVSSSIMTG